MEKQYDNASDVIRLLADNPARHLIDGQLWDSEEGIDIINPATGGPCARAPSASRDQLDQAVYAARSASGRWQECSFDYRRAALLELARLIRKHRRELAGLICLEQGKVLRAAAAEVDRAAMIVERFTTLRVSDEILRDDTEVRVVVRHRPLGVVGAITPWNMPLVLSVPKIAHALYAGNTIVLKPSPYAPLATLRLGELAKDLFPSGVLNVVAGGNQFGQWMSEHPGVDKIVFTGSIETGRRVMASAAGNLKRLTLELGGNDAAIVLPGTNLELFARQLFDAAFANCGQVCMAIKRLFVHASQYDEACERLAGMAKSLRTGDPFDPESDVGPLQNLAQYRTVEAILQDARSKPGARFHSGTWAPDGPGYFIAPTVVSHIAEGSRLVDEEPFGPVLPVLSYDSIDEVVARANKGEHGLGASVWGQDQDMATDIANRLHAGMVWVNRHGGADPLIPFGGAKQSGLGRQYGQTGLKGYMEAVTLFLPPAARRT